MAENASHSVCAKRYRKRRNVDYRSRILPHFYPATPRKNDTQWKIKGVTGFHHECAHLSLCKRLFWEQRYKTRGFVESRLMYRFKSHNAATLPLNGALDSDIESLQSEVIVSGLKSLINHLYSASSAQLSHRL